MACQSRPQPGGFPRPQRYHSSTAMDSPRWCGWVNLRSLLLPSLVFLLSAKIGNGFSLQHPVTSYLPASSFNIWRSGTSDSVTLEGTLPRGSHPSSSLHSSVEGDFDMEALAQAREDVQSGSIKAKARALYKFTRPHTIRGTILASIAGTVRALLDTPGAMAHAQWSGMIPRACIGLLALLLGNAFIVGINQIYDEPIDKLNKPFLPVASGEMSKRFAWVAVVSSGILGPILVQKFFPLLLFRLYSAGLFLGAIYSVPPIRTKKNPVLASLTIATVRGFLLNFGVYYAVKDAIRVPFAWSPKVSFIARFMTVFATVIAVTKDLPDIEGDKAFQIETFATKVGIARIAQGASACLALNYMHAILTGLLSARGSFHLVPMIGGHTTLLIMLLVRFRQLQPESMASVKQFYKHVWDLFYLEYVLYTLI